MFILINHRLTRLDAERHFSAEVLRLRFMLREKDERIMELTEALDHLKHEITSEVLPYVS